MGESFGLKFAGVSAACRLQNLQQYLSSYCLSNWSLGIQEEVFGKATLVEKLGLEKMIKKW
jgi:hypothetical protein